MQIIDDITNFIFVNDAILRADIIFIPGSSFSNLALNAAKLYKQGFAPKILPSGKYSILADSFSSQENTDEESSKYLSEYEFLKDILLQNGVKKEDIIKEDKAQNTYENSLNSKKATDALNMNIKAAIIVCKSFHARRCLMYYSLAYPDTKFFIYPVDYNGISRYSWYKTSEGIETVLGELERCGWQFKNILTDKINQNL